MATKIGGDPLLKVKANKNLIPPTGNSESQGLGKTDNSKKVIEGNVETPTDKPIKRKNDPKIKSKISSDEVSNDIGVSAPLVNAIDPNIKGGGIDSEGRFRTPYGQIVDAITKPNDYSDDRPLDVIADELNTASEFDNELSFEQQKAQVLTSYTQPTGDTPDPTATMQVSDLENEVNQTVAGDGSGAPVDDAALTNLLNSYKGKPVKYGEAAIERLGLEEYYPDINTPLQVGTYSGSIVGNNPIFVGGGGYFPFSVLDARKRAMETAAANRVAQAEKIKELFIVPTAEQYQDQLTEYGLSLYSDLGEAAGWDYNAMTDMTTEYGRAATGKIQNYRSNAKRFLQIQAQYQKTLEEWNKGDGAYVPESGWAVMNAWKDGSYNIEYLMEHPEEMEKIQSEMVSYDNMTKDGQTLKGVIDYTVSPSADPEGNYTEEELKQFESEIAIVMDHNNYDILRTQKFKFIPMSRIMAAVDQEVDYGHYYGDPEQVKKDMTAYITSLVSTEWNKSYMEASNRSTSVTVNNNNDQPEDWSIIRNIVNNTNKPEFAIDLNKHLLAGSDPAQIDQVLGGYMNSDPDETTNELDVIIPIDPKESGVSQRVSVNSMEIQDEDGNWVPFTQWQENTLINKYGFSKDEVAAYRSLIKTNGTTEEAIVAYLKGTNKVPASDAVLFSKSANSTIEGGLVEERVVLGYEDDNGMPVYMTYDSDPRDGGYIPYHHRTYEVFGGGGTFADLNVRTVNNPTYTTSAAVLEDQHAGTSAGFERTDKYAETTSENTSKTSTNTGKKPASKPAPKGKIMIP